MSKKIIFRIVIDLLIAFCVLQGWWFIALPVGLIFAWTFPYFVELFFAGILYDALFGFVAGMGVVGYLGTIFGVAVLLIVVALKKVVRR